MRKLTNQGESKLKKIVATMFAFCVTAASAQYVGTLPPNLEGKFEYSTDTDNFTTTAIWGGATLANGVGVRYGHLTARGDGVDAVRSTDNITGVTTQIKTTAARSTSKVLQATYAKVSDNLHLQGAIGLRQTTGWASYLAIPALNLNQSSTHLVFDGEAFLVLTPTLSATFAASRDTLDSVGNLGGAVYMTTLSASADYEVTDRLSVSATVGNTGFSDGNDRRFVRGRLTYTVLPEQGVSVFTSTKLNWNSDPRASYRDCGDDATSTWTCTGPYFNPERQREHTVGAQIRQQYAGLVFSGSLEAGRQWTANQGTTSSTTYTWKAGVQTQPGKRDGVTYGVTLVGVQSANAEDPTYRWHGVYAWLKAPF